MKRIIYIFASLILFLFALSGCYQHGPAATAGEKIDNAAENVKDAVTPAGPAEQAGEKIDKATGND